MLKKLLLVLPLAFVIGCNKEESTSGSGSPPVGTQDQIDAGDVPSAAAKAGGGQREDE